MSFLHDKNPAPSSKMKSWFQSTKHSKCSLYGHFLLPEIIQRETEWLQLSLEELAGLTGAFQLKP